jgi:hypothetical protein
MGYLIFLQACDELIVTIGSVVETPKAASCRTYIEFRFCGINASIS